MTKKKKITISKTYGRKLTLDFQTWTFNTSLTQDIEVTSPKELLEEADKLFDNAKKLTQRDIKKVSKEIKAKEGEDE